MLDLSPYQWQNRILLIFSPETSGLYEQQLAAFKAEHEGMDDRDLILFSIVDETVHYPSGDISRESDNKALRDKYRVKADEFTIILIGKDGGKKLKQKELLTTEKLFAIIDAMPMRRAEMKQ